MKILLDENLPRNSLPLCVLKVTTWSPSILFGYRDWTTVSFTRSREKGLTFASLVTVDCERRSLLCTCAVKAIEGGLAARPQDEFVHDFLSAFRDTYWDAFQNGDDWPRTSLP